MPSQDVHYQSLGTMNQALEKEKARKRRSKWIVIGSLLVLIVLIVIGVVVGVVVSRNNSNNNTRTSSNKGSSAGDKSGSTSTSTGNGPTASSTSTSGDPSVFEKDPNLHKSFYGMAYTPDGSLLPNCGSTLDQIIKDVQLLSQLTTRVRLYGSDCNQSALVLEAVKQTKVDLQVYLGNFVVDGDPTAYTRQRDAIKEVIQTYGTDHIAGITVGNEFMLNYVTEHGIQDVNSAAAEPGVTTLKNAIADTRSMLAGLNLAKTIPVGNSDAGSYFNTEVLSAVDYGLSNVHAWFANVTIQDAASWVNSFFQETNVAPAAALPNKPQMYIAETGWPSNSSDAGNANNGASDASIANLQIFLDTFVCQANQNNVGYFYFELFDEAWKDAMYGGVEGWWGLLNRDRSLKNIKIPDCAAP